MRKLSPEERAAKKAAEVAALVSQPVEIKEKPAKKKKQEEAPVIEETVAEEPKVEEAPAEAEVAVEPEAEKAEETPES